MCEASARMFQEILVDMFGTFQEWLLVEHPDNESHQQGKCRVSFKRKY